MLKFLILWTVLTVSFSSFAINFSDIPVATTIEQSRELFPARQKEAVKYGVERELKRFHGDGHNSFGVPAAARAYAGLKIEELNQAILDPDTKVYANYGTNIVIAGGLCKRNGDYDFMLQNLMRVAYWDIRNGRLLNDEAFRKLVTELMSATGNKHYRTFSLGICGTHVDTENHLLMTEGSRYLTNQLLIKYFPETLDNRDLYDNNKNGFNLWMSRHLQQFLIHHFDEYNSRPYQGYTILAINNIHSFAESPMVKTAAQMVLDYNSAVFAVQAIGGRRSVPFRRQDRYEGQSQVHVADCALGRHALLAGNHDFLKGAPIPGDIPYGKHFTLGSALSDYRLPDVILDLMINPESRDFYQRIHHQSAEIYSASKSFQLAAGGYYINRFDMGTKQNDGWARPTVLIPAGETSLDFKDWIRFEGHKKRMKRRNTCLYGNFACGNNLVIPEKIPTSCREVHGPWTFMNFNSTECPLKYGIYVSLYKKKCDSLRCKRRGKNFGFMEVREASELSFTDFKLTVLQNNGHRRYSSKELSHYTTTKGELIRFQILPFWKKTWEIHSVGGRSMERNFDKWPLAQGDVIKADGKGLVTVKNSRLKKSLILDLRDPANPSRRVVEN